VGGGPTGLAVFATRGEVVLARSLGGPPRQEFATFEPLPHAVPLVAQLGEEIRFVQVIVDHTGGEIRFGGAGRLVRSREVDGTEEHPIHKVKSGGWRQSHIQRAAEESWRRNADEVAEVAAELGELYGAEVVVVAGDPRSRSMFVEKLPERWRGRVVTVDGGARGPGADPEEVDEVTMKAIAERAASRMWDALDRFRAQLDHDAAAGVGLPAVVAALQRGQVDTVLLADNPSWNAQLWIGSDPVELSEDPAQLKAMNVPDPRQARADAALLRALTCTDGRLVLVRPDELGAEVAAVLRYADPATRHR
jgi:hypothetical protein